MKEKIVHTVNVIWAVLLLYVIYQYGSDMGLGFTVILLFSGVFTWINYVLGRRVIKKNWKLLSSLVIALDISWVMHLGWMMAKVFYKSDVFLALAGIHIQLVTILIIAAFLPFVNYDIGKRAVQE
jgi:uncharacterized membrane protein